VWSSASYFRCAAGAQQSHGGFAFTRTNVYLHLKRVRSM
jgi:hypothetical protein